MIEQERNHELAIGWIEGELENLISELGKPNASSAARSSVTLAFMLRAIDEGEHRHYASRIDKIYANYNDSLRNGASA